ncbi:hypothetical protein C9439_07060 [archaeon SCG-AAA382B04]|nr:hypothetical protein C9439_07060 [archaeon SCG-AAA382B04]
MSNSDYMETFEEIDEVLAGIRSHLKRIILVFAVGVAIGWPVSVFVLRKIIDQGLSMTQLEGVKIIQTKVLETILLNTKISMVFALFFTLPLLIYYGYNAANERIDRLELDLNFSKKETLVVGILAIILFIAGVLYAYYLMVPITIRMLAWWTREFVSNQIRIQYTIGAFVNFVLLLLIAFGITFELPIVVNLSIRSGLVSYNSLKSKRKHVYVVLLILSGLITGPNIITQVMIAIPLVAFFEIGLFSGRYMKES